MSMPVMMRTDPMDHAQPPQTVREMLERLRAHHDERHHEGYMIDCRECMRIIL